MRAKALGRVQGWPVGRKVRAAGRRKEVEWRSRRGHIRQILVATVRDLDCIPRVTGSHRRIGFKQGVTFSKGW